MRTMLSALDHLVLATPDLHATTDWLLQHTGVQASAGGQHIGRGTRNMLCSFGATSYLEIVGPDPEQPDPDGPRPFGIDDLQQAALVSWAIAVPAMADALGYARANGYDAGPAAAMQRRRPDGVLLSWTLTLVPCRALPFLIDWQDSPHPAPDAAPGLTLTSLTVRHPDTAFARQGLAALKVEGTVHGGPDALLAELAGPAGTLALG